MTSRRFEFRRFLALTTALTFVLILLGVYTRDVGAGWTCAGRWPLCDGAVFGLFPANWTSFVEWFHRFVAMLVGFMLLGGTVGAVRRFGYGDRISRALIVALVVLPVQVLLGAATVKTYILEFGTRRAIQPLISTAHHGSALIIFAGLLAATLWAYETTRSSAR